MKTGCLEVISFKFMQEDHVTSLYTCSYKAFQGDVGRFNIDYRVFSLPNMVLLHPFSPFTVPFIWVMSFKSTHFSVSFGPGDVGRCAPSSCRPALASGEGDFPCIPQSETRHLVAGGLQQPKADPVPYLAWNFVFSPLLSGHRPQSAGSCYTGIPQTLAHSIFSLALEF